MAENAILETDQLHTIADSLQLSSGPYEVKWVSYTGTGLYDHLRECGFSIVDIPLIVDLGKYDLYEVVIKENRIGDLGKLMDLLTPFHEDSTLLRVHGKVEAFRLTYHAYKTKKKSGLRQEEEEPWKCRVRQFKPRLRDLDIGARGRFPYYLPS